MRVVTTFPRAVRRLEHVWIPMPDGCRLAARLWLPADAAAAPVPAVLEYLPYRKRDLTRTRDEPMHHWFAGHGYAAVRVDVRGTGDSEGTLADEYSEQELADGEAVIAWLAAQPWCTGAVGMIGKSWGGFNALQLAARRPPALRAVVSVCASDDRWRDDAHYMGGGLLNENLAWGAVLMTTAALPPDPALVGDGAREQWLARLDAAVCFPEIWLRHQRRDAYWRRGSVSEDFAAVGCPVYAVGGWADAYTSAIPRLLAGLRVPVKALVGPWAHRYPHNGAPGRPIGFLQEVRRWWDEWLAGIPTGVLDEPCYRVWMPEGTGGRWVAEDEWPAPRIAPRRWRLAPGALVAGDVAEARLEHASLQSVGLAAGEWCAFGGEGEGPGEQRDDDARSLTFDSAPLADRLEILGAPAVTLDLAVDRPQALVAVRLNEVRPDGASARVTYTVLDLAHRDGSAAPRPLEPGRRHTVRIVLRDVAHAFARGSRLRLAVSTAYWPVVWPAPEPVRLTVFTGASRLELPVRPPRADDRLRPFEAAETGPPAPYVERRPAHEERRLERDADGAVVCTVVREGGGVGQAGPGRLAEIDLDVEQTSRRRYRIRDDDPLSARVEVMERVSLARGGWRVGVETHAECSATRDAFRLRARLVAREGGRVVRERRWESDVPREGSGRPAQPPLP
jgi:hypothetical protein